MGRAIFKLINMGIAVSYFGESGNVPIVLLPCYEWLDVNRYAFHRYLFVALSATTSGFALSKWGGDRTWFHPSLGSCGLHNTDNDLIVAVDAVTIQTFPGATANPNNSPMCGRQMKVTYGGNSVVVKVADTCPARECTVGSVDLSPAVFQQLAPLSVGRLHGVSWTLP